MTVIPVGAGLSQIEFVGERLARRDRWKRHERYAIHGIGQKDAMPVNRRVHVHLVVDTNHCVVTLDETQGRPRQLAIDGEGLDGLPGEVHLLPGNGEVIFHCRRRQHRHRHKQRQAAKQRRHRFHEFYEYPAIGVLRTVRTFHYLLQSG